MKTLLTIGATAFAIVAAIAAFLRLGLPWWIRRRLQVDPAGHGGIAPTISFEPLPPDSPWQQPGTPQTIAEFAALGYTAAGRYRVPEIAGMELQFGVKTDGTAVAVYDHIAIPTFFDVIRAATNDTSACVTTSPMFDPGHTPNGSVGIGDPSLTPAEAVPMLDELSPTGELLPATTDNICDLAIAGYERQVAHILTRTAPTPDEMRIVSERLAEATGTPAPTVDDEGRRLAAEIHRWHREHALSEMIIQEFLRTGAYSADRWEHLRHRVVVIHERMSDAHRLSVLPNPEHATVIGQVARPVNATIYILPQ